MFWKVLQTTKCAKIRVWMNVGITEILGSYGCFGGRLGET